MTIAAQHAMATEDGVPKLARYEEKTSEITDKRDEAISSIRSGDLLWVADATVLADGRDRLVMLLKEMSSRKNPVGMFEGRTKRTSLSPHDGQHIAFEAAARWSSANKRFGLMTASEAGALGGKTAGRRGRKTKLPKTEAAKYWCDPKLWYMDTDAITKHINEVGESLGFKGKWSKNALYNAIGKRGMPAGPKVNLKK